MEPMKGHPHGVDGVNLRGSKNHSTSLNSHHIQKQKLYPFWRLTGQGHLPLPKNEDKQHPGCTGCSGSQCSLPVQSAPPFAHHPYKQPRLVMFNPALKVSKHDMETI